jgi:3-hydroxyisobutyrate dehydrogenase-like beta-hydroxyacid dehydrogenase
MSYALALAQQLGVDARGAKTADDLLRQASEAGFGQMYWPVLSRVIDENPAADDAGVAA